MRRREREREFVCVRERERGFLLRNERVSYRSTDYRLSCLHILMPLPVSHSNEYSDKQNAVPLRDVIDLQLRDTPHQRAIENPHEVSVTRGVGLFTVQMYLEGERSEKKSTEKERETERNMIFPLSPSFGFSLFLSLLLSLSLFSPLSLRMRYKEKNIAELLTPIYFAMNEGVAYFFAPS
jgi:hypothetical protein